MKTLKILIFSFLFALSTLCNAEWTFIGANDDGTEYSIDIGRMQWKEGFVYVWRLSNYQKPNKNGDLSLAVYQKADCSLRRWKNLEYVFHKERNGDGTPTILHSEESDWIYPPPDSVLEEIIKLICR